MTQYSAYVSVHQLLICKNYNLFVYVSHNIFSFNRPNKGSTNVVTVTVALTIISDVSKM